MASVGFSIQCPHCFSWSDWSGVDPRTKVINLETEWPRILDAVRTGSESFTDEKLLTSKHYGVDCPMPFRAVITRPGHDANELLNQLSSWGPQRAFRLWKPPNHTERWSRFAAVLFTMGKVPRLRHVELETLFNRKLLTRAIHGISAAIDAPFTIYVSEIFNIRSRDQVFWSPVEGYSQQQWEAVPPKYNPLCKLCRSKIIEKLSAELAKNLSLNDCPIRFAKDGKCGGREAACSVEDWNRCPAFLKRRLESDPCYKYDRALIKAVETNWSKGLELLVSHRCWNNFTELAVPIVIHDHLVAVAVSGQLMSPTSRLPNITTVLRHAPMLVDCKSEIQDIIKSLSEKAKCDHLSITEPKRAVITIQSYEQKLDNIVKGINDNVDQIETIGDARYLHIRQRYEMAFREELLGRLEIAMSENAAAVDSRLVLIDRLREFWAFSAVYVMVWNQKNKEIRLVAKSRKRCKPVVHKHPVLLGKIEAQFPQAHPLSWTVELPGVGSGAYRWIKEFHAVCDKSMVKNGTSFMIAFPMVQNIYVIAYRKRDVDVVSPMTRANKIGISPFTRESIINTTSAAIRVVDKILQNKGHQQTLRSFIMALTEALELNDPYTAGHSQEVARISQELAIEIGLPPHDQETAWLAGMVHDIGKLVIDPAILSKTGKLNHIQTIMMEQHPEIGFMILQKVGDMENLSNAVRQHHERYKLPDSPGDTHGYPHQITGEKIDVFAQLIAVADTYSAITSDRPYRKGGTPKEALRIILKEKGRQLHPGAVDAFFRAYRKHRIKTLKLSSRHMLPR